MNLHCKGNCNISWQIMCFGQKCKTTSTTTTTTTTATTTTTTKHRTNPFQRRNSNPEPITSRPPRHPNLSFEVKLFNCFNVMGRNINLKNKATFAAHTLLSGGFLLYFNIRKQYLAVSHIHANRIYFLSIAKGKIQIRLVKIYR